MDTPDNEGGQEPYRGPERRASQLREYGVNRGRDGISTEQAFRLIGVDIYDQDSVDRFNEALDYAAKERAAAAVRGSMWRTGVISAISIIVTGLVTWAVTHFNAISTGTKP